jgi:hypothetical protein
MNFPPSLPPDVIERSFVASNGELGLQAADVATFLQACERDGVEVFGWEAWIIDHRYDGDKLIPSQGSWCGFIPFSGKVVVCGGSTPLTEIAGAICDPEWAPLLRFNITV